MKANYYIAPPQKQGEARKVSVLKWITCNCSYWNRSYACTGKYINKARFRIFVISYNKFFRNVCSFVYDYKCIFHVLWILRPNKEQSY